LYDSTGNDTFVDRSTHSSMSGSGYFNQVQGFWRVEAIASLGNDTADLGTVDSRHTFYGTGDLGMLYGSGRGTRVMRGFDTISAEAAPGTMPTADIEAL